MGSSADSPPQEAPNITSSPAATLTAGASGSFTVTTTGNPLPTISESGALPSGVAFTDNGNGTATLAGVPTQNGSYPITISSSNGVTSNATQDFTLTVDQPPAITSPASATFIEGSSSNFRADSAGYPAATLTETGSLPKGVAFIDSGNGIATFSGTPATGTPGIYPIVITAANGIAPSATQKFTLRIIPIEITTSTLPAAKVGTKYSATLKAAGGNLPYSWSLATGSKPLPPGLKLSSTGGVSGMPTKKGAYSFTVKVVDTKTKSKPVTQISATKTLSIVIA